MFELLVDDAKIRAEGLLREHLTDAQWRCYSASGYFFVRGGATGRQYRIGKGGVWELSEQTGARKRYYCVHPSSLSLENADIYLAQKIAMELDETETLAIANASSPEEYVVTEVLAYIGVAAVFLAMWYVGVSVWMFLRLITGW